MRVPFALLAAALLCAPALAQVGPAHLVAAERAERARVRALTGGVGLPPLAPLSADSPMDHIFDADRQMVEPDDVPVSDGGPPQMLDGNLPAGPAGTGTDKPEIFKYQIPGNYDARGDAVPLIVAYHGYAMSAGSVATMSTIDEESNLRGWFYLAPTGIDDELFGSPVCQQNVSAAIQWMLDHFNIDPDRLYFVGFSMGGGIVANYTARHRDPTGIMPAATAVVSGTMDWMIEYVTVPSHQGILQNPYNFGGSPAQQPFKYQQASTLHFTPGSYPPLPGLLDLDHTMAANLGSTPLYVTWDLNDTVAAVLAEEPVLLGVLAGLGGSFLSKPVVGTPTPHSWGVLNEVHLFNWFDGKVANRSPSMFAALIDRNERVSWIDFVQDQAGAFSRVSGVATTGTRTLSASGVQNADTLRLHVDGAGLLGPALVHALAAADEPDGYTLELIDDTLPPAWLQDPVTSVMLTGIQSDPALHGLLVPVPGLGSTAVDVVRDADYWAQLSSAPEPATIGGNVTVTVDGPPSATSAYLLIGLSQALGSVKGHSILVQLGGLTVILPVPLLPGGDLQATGSLPNTPALHGVQILMQGLLLSGSGFDSASNLWLMDIS